MSEPKCKQLQQIIDESNRIVFFGGAGVSTESGIPDFRSQDGLYNQQYRYPPEKILSHSFFMANTEEFYDFYRKKFLYPHVKPNPAHYTLASLEKAGKLIGIVTQNVDGLHQLAGSKQVFELHGSIHRNYCLSCHKNFALETILCSIGIPRCQCGGTLKPDVVLYEEPLNQGVIELAVNALQSADTLIVGGTSLNVYPAAGLTSYFHGQKLVLLNRDETSVDQNADLVIREPIGQILGTLQIATA
ncbi:MAG: NAD-dependent protein deacylase [Dehalococcoidia bacterium]|nr:NAD-dependent protein deacylase [Dehalococcoidia bacterium]